MIKSSAMIGAAETDQSDQASQLSRLIFVGGSPRSGTTLVQRVLDFHPEIYGGPEFDFVPRIAELFRDMRNSIEIGRIDSILDKRSLVQAFRSLLVDLFLPKLEIEGARYLSEKTPSNVLAFDLLEACAPEAKKIFVLRDPRDVVSSMLEVGRRQRLRQGRASQFTGDTVAAVDYMNECLRAGTAAVESSARCLLIYYEDLVCDALAVANKMYRFIGVDELDRLELENKKFQAARNQDSWIDWSTPGTLSGGVEKGRVGVAVQRLAQSDLEYIYFKAFRHPLLAKRYSIPSAGRTARVRWCVARTRATRIKNRARDGWSFLRQCFSQ
jgi:Sulfotransferase family